MNRPARRDDARPRQPAETFGLLAAALVVVGGLLVALLPQHALSLLQVGLVGLAVGAGLHVLMANVGEARPGAEWLSPFTRQTYRTEASAEPPGLDRLRYTMSRERRPGGAPLPPETGRHLSWIVRDALARRGIDLSVHRHRREAQALLSPLTWAVVEDESRPPVRGSKHRQKLLRGDSADVAEIVHAVLDDLDRLENGAHQTMRGTR